MTQSFYNRLALLAQELLHVIRPERALAAGAAGLPAAEGLDAGPGAGRGAGRAVGVGHAGLYVIEEVLQLLGVPAEYAGGQPVFRLIAERHGLFQRADVGDAKDRQKQLVLKEVMVFRQAVDQRRRDVVTVAERLGGQDLSAEEDLSVFAAHLDILL